MYYVYHSKVGAFAIVQRYDGRWHVMFNGDSLGSYVTAVQVADDLAGGQTSSPSPDVDTSTLRIPADLTEWERTHR